MFGRPLLRLSDRPPVHIPPRKRRRITADEEDSVQDEQAMIEDQKLDEEEGEGGDQQLVLHADLNEDDSEEDDDFAPSDSEDDDGEDSDMEASSEDSDSEHEVEDQDNEPEKIEGEEKEAESPVEEAIEECLVGVKDPKTRAQIRKLHAAFPTSKLGVCRHVMKKTHNDLGEAYDALITGFPAVKSRRRVTESLQETGDLKVKKTRAKAPVVAAEPLKPLESPNHNPDEIDLDEEEHEKEEDKDDESGEEGSDDNSDPMLNYYDQNGLPPGSISLNGTSPGNVLGVANSKIKFTDDNEIPSNLDSTPTIDKMPDDNASSEESDSSEEDDSSDDDSSEVSSDSSDEDMDASSDGESSSSDSDSDSSSDSSSDDDEPEQISSKAFAPTAKPITVPVPSLETVKPVLKARQQVSAPGKGLSGTRARNDRRRRAEALARFKERGFLPADTTIEEFKLLDPKQLGSQEEAGAALEMLRSEKAYVAAAGQPTDDTAQGRLVESNKFELRRKELLASLAAGGVDIEQESTIKANKKKSRKQEDKTRPKDKSAVTAAVAEATTDKPLIGITTNTYIPNVITAEAEPEAMNIDEIDLPESPPANSHVAEQAKASTPVSAQPGSAGSGPRRAKLDLGAGRRMLFGALGIKTPKTKKDEEKVQADLMKFVRQPLAPKVVAEPESHPEVAVDEDPDAWKANIIYRAVECVQEGVELSEPPFPFKQRWDPQQLNDRNGKRKKDQRDQSQFYDENPPSKKQKRRKGKNNQQAELEYEHPEELNYDENYDAYDESVQLTEPQTQNTESDMIGTQAPSELVSQNPDDLAALPEDVSSLPNLSEGAAKVGMTIAFKCLEMSEATKWQPKISPYRTAIVIAISNNGEFQLSLAMRDREPGKAYDEETGERIYGKFEMPDDDEDMDGEDDGVVYHQYYDFVEPKIVQEPPAGINQIEAGLQTNEQAKGDTSATLSNEELSTESQPEAQLSHVTETQIFQTMEDVEPIQVDEVQEDVGEQKPPGIIVSAEPSQEIAFDTPLANSVLTMDPVTPFTPGLKARKAMYTEALTPSVQISEDNRRNIAHMMKDAGFRSSVPSSIVRGIQPETPGDMAVFQKLMDEMAETSQETPYSPKFNGFESSPPHTQNNMQVDEDEDEIALAAQLSSAQKVPQSSWETVNPQTDDSADTPRPIAPVQPSHTDNDAANDSESTSDSSSDSSSDNSASPSPEQVKPKKNLLPRKVPISRAQELWEQLQPKNKRTSNYSSPEQEEISQAISTSEVQSNTSVQYPKLSDNSSLMSQIADHGRQPDFAFEDSEMLNMETPKLTDSSKAFTSLSGKRLGSGTIVVNKISKDDKSKDTSNFEDPFSGSETDLPAQKVSRGRTNNAEHVSEIPQEFSSSDFPSLAALSQYSQIFKEERSKSIEAKIGRASFKKPARVIAEEDDFEGDLTPRKASEQRKDVRIRKISRHQQPKNAPPASQPKALQARASPPSNSQSRPTQSQPAYSSHVVDLTLTSSDVEPDETEPLIEPEARPSKKNKRSFGDDDEDDYESGAGGWVAKSSGGHGSGKRQPSGNFKESSQNSLNAKRKNTHR